MNKLKYSQLDIIIILLVTFIAIAINLQSIGSNAIIKDMISVLFLFIPGYSTLITIYPQNNISNLKTVVYSILISAGFLIFIMVLENIFPNSSIITRPNLSIILSIITITLAISAYIRRNSIEKNSLQNMVVCDKCNGYYPLKEGESIEDPQNLRFWDTENEVFECFEKCKCGGNLYYSDPNYKKNLDIPKWYNPYDLIFTLVISALCLIFLLIAPLNQILSGILGSFLIIFLSGYALVAAVFPSKQKINLTERIGLSFILSLLSTLIIGLILYFIGFNGNLNLIIMLLSFLTIIGSILSYMRRLEIPLNEQFYPEINDNLNNIKKFVWNNGNRKGKLSVLLIILLIVSIGTTIYLVAYPNPGESFTEFYLLGPNGKATDYPTNLTSGTNGKVIIGIVNHEHQNTTYKMVVTSNGNKINERNIKLTDGQKMDINYSFVPAGMGKKKIEFLLYKLPDEKNAYLSLNLNVNVK